MVGLIWRVHHGSNQRTKRGLGSLTLDILIPRNHHTIQPTFTGAAQGATPKSRIQPQMYGCTAFDVGSMAPTSEAGGRRSRSIRFPGLEEKGGTSSYLL